MRQIQILVVASYLVFGFVPLLSAQDKQKIFGDGQFQEVVAEGVGSSADEAIKDAYRNAVRQVVGAVVDAETLVKNDELIDEKVLVYSDGFIKTYHEIDGSKKVKSGLHRIKINAQVERRSVIAKIKSANVTMKKVDGKGLFAEAVTQIEAENGNAQILAKSLADLPTLLTASVEGKPEYDRSTSEVVVNVVIEPDQKAYNVFVTRLEETLQKICLSKESLLLEGSAEKDSNQRSEDTSKTLLSVVRPATALLGPTITDKNTNTWCLWVCSSTTRQHQSQRWNSYLLDCDASEVAASLVMPLRARYSRDGELFRINGSKTMLKLSFTNAEGSVVAEDETELSIDRSSAYEQSWTADCSSLPLLRHAVLRNRKGLMMDINFTDGLKDIQSWHKEQPYFKDYTINAFVAPFVFTVKQYDYDKAVLYYSPRKIVTLRLKMTLDELKQISNIASKIEYECDREHTK